MNFINLNISREHCKEARYIYTVVEACATLITARKLRASPNGEIIYIPQISIQRSFVYSKKTVIPNKTIIGDNNLSKSDIAFCQLL